MTKLTTLLKLTLSLICLAALPLIAQEVRTTAADYYDVQFLDDQTVIACGSQGAIRRSSDGGATWEVIPTEFQSQIFWSLDFIDRNRGWAAGTGGIVIETQDGGTTWTQIREPGSPDVIIHHLAMSSSGIGIAVGRPGLMLRTDDFGQSWSPVGPSLQFPMFRVEVLADDNFVACGFGTVLYSNDKGQTWSVVEFDFEGNPATLFWQASATDDQGNVYLGGTWGVPGFILHSSDGGESWNNIVTPGGATTLAADSGNLIYTAATTQLTYSTDNGENWDSATMNGPSIEVPDFQLVARAAGIRGDNALVLTERNGILRSTDAGANWSTISFLPNTSLFAGVSEGEGRLYAVGSSNAFLASQDGGATWLPDLNTSLNQNFIAFDILFPANDFGIVVGSMGTIARRSPEQNSWTTVQNDANLGISYRAVDFADDGEVGIAVGHDPVQVSFQGWLAAFTNDAGQTWDSSPSRRFNAPFIPYAVLSLGNGRWIVAGSNRDLTPDGVIALSTDNGSSWSYLEDVAIASILLDVVRVSGETLVAVGENGVIVRSTDNGDTWARVETESDAALTTVDFATDNLGVAAGVDVVMYTSDGGRTWQQISDLFGVFTARSVVYDNWDAAYIFGSGFGVARLDIDAATGVEASVEQGSAAPRVWMRPIVPNPVNDIVRTAVFFRNSVPLDQIKVRVFSYMGAEVLDVSNSFIYQSPQQGFRHGEFSTAQLGNGVYLLNITDGQFNHTLSFVVMKR